MAAATTLTHTHADHSYLGVLSVLLPMLFIGVGKGTNQNLDMIQIDPTNAMLLNRDQGITKIYVFEIYSHLKSAYKIDHNPMMRM